MIVFRQDSDGNSFQLWKQQQLFSCGVAASWMARCLVRQVSFGETEWELAVRTYRNGINKALTAMDVDPAAPMTLDPRAFPKDQASFGSTFAGAGMFADQLAASLKADGFNVNHVDNSNHPAPLATHLLGDRRAAIVLIAWNGKGGHFIVAARTNAGGKIVYLDPWDGEIVERANDSLYVPKYNNSGKLWEILYLS